MSKLWRYLIYSNVYVTLPIASLTLFFYQLFSIPLNYYYLFVISSTLVLYPLHRLYGAHKATHPVLAQRVALQNQQFTIGLVSIALGATIYCFWQLPFSIIMLTLPLSLVAIGYSLPLIYWNNKWVKLREIPAIKVAFIALVVTATCCSLPSYFFTPLPIGEVISISIATFLFILGITIPFDIRDIAIDQKFQLKTLPIFLGVSKAKKLSGAALIVSTIIVGTSYGFTNLFYSWTITCTITIWLISKISVNRSRVFYALAFEGALIQIPLWLLFFRLIESLNQ